MKWSRSLGATGHYLTPPYVQGELEPRHPGLTGKSLRLPGTMYQMQAQLSVARTSDRDITSFEASQSYAFADNIGEQADNPRVSFGYNRRLGKVDKLYGLVRQTWYRDGIKKVEYSNQSALGLGIKTINTPKVKLDLVPALALYYDKKGTPFDNDWLLGGGAMGVLQVMVGPVSMVEHKLTAYRAFTESEYYGVESTLGFKGMVAKHVGFSISWASRSTTRWACRRRRFRPTPCFRVRPSSRCAPTTAASRR